MLKAKTNERIVFLDYLRAFACLLVVVGHIYFVGPNDPKTVSNWLPDVSSYIFGPDPNAENPYGHALAMLTIHTGIGLGSLGVGLFFLISGFVILRALDREAWRIFMTRRFFRIFPTNATCMVLIGLVTAMYCRLANVTDPIHLRSVVTSSLLLINLTQDFPATPVLWTLEVEVLFYLLMGALAWRFTRLTQRILLVASLVCIFVSAIADFSSRSSMVLSAHAIQLAHLGLLLSNVTMLLIGSMIYRNFSDGWSKNSWISVLISIGLYVVAVTSHEMITGASTGIDIVNSAVALGIFSAAFVARMEWKWIRPLRWIGDISYPLYLLHVPLGWMVLVMLAKAGWNIHAAGISAVLTAIACAWVMHVLVERTSQRVGRRVAIQLFSTKSTVAK
ncbi:acyltransferase [Paraburkholderia sp. SARCC-3016]|uniref:acyltransferase family protein n=1 Tax=Paraburkholderia sp. SARCC-3016 TaxID=3058611 RepID=UPI002807D5B6|nr:acyltransferase [Paraburkholderia sp. SARCC-3016]MDQ7978072.1 acyltransferase [Paraburkholderia sp. SARCC-3016]